MAENACTDCGDTGITYQTERACSCEAGLPFKVMPPAVGIADLLRQARWYVNDALEAYEHSDGRELLTAIDAALSADDIMRTTPNG